MSLRCWGRWLALLLLVSVLLVPELARAQAFPFYSRSEALGDPQDRETWAMWPFYSDERTTTTVSRGVHPLFNYWADSSNGHRDVDVLWPIYSYRFRPVRQNATDYERSYLFPFYYNRTETRFNRPEKDLFILPFWFQGSEGNTGQYFILFPIIWYANNARVEVPLFPKRAVTFGAIFPLAGDVRGYFNRDRITFFLWPLFVYSHDGHGQDYNAIYSFVWPITGLYKGPEVSGFRLWPLFATVRKKDEYTRSYWLWPLGHHRKGRISKTNADQEDVTLFLPFYANFKRPNIRLKTYFPFYGRLEVGDRVSEGYVLALYNRETNTRLGYREDRYLLFIVRRRVPLPGFEPDPEKPKTTYGGGVFPFYTRTQNPKRISKNIIWPFHQYRVSRYDDYTFKRSYVVPFFSSQQKLFSDGRENHSKYVFPIFRTRKTLDDQVHKSYLHLFVYTYAAPMDRNWAPLWTYWEKEENLQTGRRTIRVLKEMSRYERDEDGNVQRRFNLPGIDYHHFRSSDGETSGSTKLLWGAAERRRDEKSGFRMFGVKLF